MSPIAQLVMSLVTKIVENQITRHHMNKEIENIDNEVKHELYKRDRVIGILESKIKELEENVDDLLFKKIDEIVKKIQDKTPFFVDPFVKNAGEVVKVELDKATDLLVESLVNLIEKGKDKVEEVTGIDLTPDSEPVNDKDLEFHDDVDPTEKEVTEPPDNDPPGFSENAKEILKNLKSKHKNKNEE